MSKEKPSTFMLPPAHKVRKMSDDKPRVRYEVRREKTALVIALWFDECQLGSRIIVGGDERLARMVESGELRLTKNSKLVFEDGTPYHHPGRSDKIDAFMCVW
jgi:hypothetical protein